MEVRMYALVHIEVPEQQNIPLSDRCMVADLKHQRELDDWWLSVLVPELELSEFIEILSKNGIHHYKHSEV